MTSILVLLTTIFANLANLATQIVLPRFVDAAGYSTFAVLWAWGQFASTAVFEWMRFSVLRFGNGADTELSKSRFGLLVRMYFFAGILLLCLALASLALAGVNGVFFLAALVLFYAAAQGIFDGLQAFFRSYFFDKQYCLSWFARSLLVLIFVLLTAYSTHSGTAAFAVLIVCFPASLLLSAWRRIPDLAARARKPWDKTQIKFLVNYGIYAAAATTLSSLLAATTRLISVDVIGLTGSGGALLALDLSQKAVSVVGLAINLIVLQRSIKAIEFGPLEHRARAYSDQFSMSLLGLAPIAALFYVAQPYLLAAMVPHGYQMLYMQNIGLACASAALLCIRQYSLDSLFVVSGDSRLSVVGPVVALVGSAAATYLIKLSGHADFAVSGGLVVGLLLSVICSWILVTRRIGMRWPIKEVVFALSACAVIVVTFSFFGGGLSAILGIIAVAAAGLIYLAAWFGFNLGNVRSLLHG